MKKSKRIKWGNITTITVFVLTIEKLSVIINGAGAV